MTVRYSLLIVCFVSLSVNTHAQDTGGFTAAEQAELDALDEELSSFDSTGIIGLIDSLIRLDEAFGRSRLSVKMGYNNESLQNNREALGSESGYYTGLVYYHKSGAFIDITAYGNSQFHPNYYLTNPSIGYIGTLGKHWSYIGSYEHYFFNKNAEDGDIYFPYTDGISASLYFSTQYFDTGPDYSLTLGSETAAHKLTYNFIGNFEVKNVGFIDKINLRPSIGLLWGNQSIYYVKIDRRYLDPRKRFTLVEDNEFGLMNISFLAPVYFTIGSVNISMAYQINLPQELPGEALNYSSSQVFSASLSYFIKL